MRRERPDRICVVGAGVVGLTVAVHLAEQGLAVDVLARDLPLESSSAAEPGLPVPLMAAPRQQVARWTAVTLARLRELAAGAHGEDAGVADGAGTLVQRVDAPAPSWVHDLAGDAGARACVPDAVGHPVGWQVELPVVDTDRYLPHLQARLRAAGGTLTRLALVGLPRRGTVVNATGAAARQLAPDPLVTPLRGQVAVLDNPGLRGWWLDQDPDCLPTVVVAHRDRVVVGATVEPGTWSTVPEARTTRVLVRRAVQLLPALAGARVRGARVGLRPHRPQVRVEQVHSPTDDDPGRQVVHCYGYGGAGLAVSWGVAEEVARRLQTVPV